jgi:transcriptional regulator with XRE-family HTH domain
MPIAADIAIKVNETAARDPLDVYTIGLKLRTLRVGKQLTLARLAQATGYSTALLSKLETDRMVPTLHTLEGICRVYGIGLGHFFCEPQHHSLAITRQAHIAEGRDHRVPKLTPLHLPTADGRLVSKIVDFPPGVAASVGECGSRTEVTAYVLEGSLHLSIAGAPEVLEQGDCIVMNTDQVLVWSADPASRCRVLIVSAK